MLDLPLLLAQLIAILAVSRFAGHLLRRLGQPQVIEMLAGLALGPSLLGAISPDALHALFPADRMAPLATLSQLGVLLFMFVVGLRLDWNLLRGRAHIARVASQASIAVPFLLGVAVAVLLYPRLAGPGVGFLPFALFVGAAMSVTAFPVLARILGERGMLSSKIGAVALACAAVDDVTAWGILAAVVAVARAGQGLAPFAAALGLTALWVAVIVFAVRPLLARLDPARIERGTAVTPSVVGIAVIVALVSALITERAGVHALFGAFLAGAVMPRGSDLAQEIAGRIEDVVSVVLLPIFFAFTGLRTTIGLVDSPAAWGICVLIFLIAVAGKLGGSAIAVRASGMSWRDGLSIGILLNTRGLMELVILNVGLDIGVISPTLFTMMVLMAIGTTVMTSPLLELVRADRARPAEGYGLAR